MFRKSSVDKVSSPEQLNDYIKVTNPSVWIILIAVAALLAAAVVWAVFGALPTTVNASGVAGGDSLTLYVTPEAAGLLSAGMTVSAGGEYGTVAEVGGVPLSYDEASESMNDYTAYALGLGDWNVPVTVSISGLTEGSVVSAVITTDTVKPISFLLN